MLHEVFAQASDNEKCIICLPYEDVTEKRHITHLVKNILENKNTRKAKLQSNTRQCLDWKIAHK